MAQIIKHRRGLIGGVKNLTARNGELIIASGSISDLSGPFVFIGSPNVVDEGVAGAFNSVSKLYTGTAAPTITAATYGSILDGTPYYASGNKSLYILNNSNVGNTKVDLTGNIEGNTISGVTINSITGSEATFSTFVSASALQVTGNTSLNGTLTVDNTSNFKNSVSASALQVTGNTAMDGTLRVEGVTYINDNLYITGTTYQTGSIDITGDVKLGGNIYIGNQTTDLVVFGGEVSSSIIPTVNNQFDLGSPVNAWNDLYVSGTAYIENISLAGISVNSISLPGNLSVSGTTTLSGSVLVEDLTNNRVVIAGVGGLLEDDANFTFDGTVLNIGQGNAEIDVADGDIRTSGSLTVESTSQLKGAVGINSTLDVTGSSTLKSTLEVKGATGLNSTLDVTGSATLKSSLEVKGATELNSTLDVTGSATLKSSLEVKGATGLNSSLDVTGSATLKDTLTVNSTSQLKGAVGINTTLNVTGSVEFNDSLDVTGTTTLNGDTYVTGLTQNRIVLAGSGGKLQDNNNLVFDTAKLQVGMGAFEVDAADGDIRTSGSVTIEGTTTIKDDLNVTGILTVTGDTRLQSNLYVSGNLEVLGSSTNVNIESQTVNIGDNIIQVNAYSPFDRYAGLSAYDSGSSGLSGSLLWDSTNDYWLFQYSNANTGKIVSTTTGSMGTETSLTSGYFPIATSAGAIGDSILTYTGTTLALNTNKFTVDSGTGDTLVSGNLTLSYSGGTDNGTNTSAILFRNSSNVVGYVSTTETTDVLDGILGYKNSDGALVFSTVIDGGVY